MIYRKTTGSKMMRYAERSTGVNPKKRLWTEAEDNILVAYRALMDMTLMSTPLCNESHKKGKKNMGEMTSTGVNLKKRLWTEAEDNILVGYVYTFGDRKWSNVHRVTGLSRTGKSCRLRWRDQLRPGLKKEQFSPEEEMLIGELHHRLGNQWAVIAQYLPGRTDNSVKNFWYNRCKKRTRGSMKNVLKVDEHDQSNLPPPTENDSKEWTSANLCEIYKVDRLLFNLSELSSIQDEETHQAFADEVALSCLPLDSSDSLLPDFYTSSTATAQHKDVVDPISSLTNFPDFSPNTIGGSLIAEEFALNTFPECYDGLVDLMLTEGDIVDYWLKLPCLDGSLNQVCICQESICSNNGPSGNTSPTICTVAEAELDVLPDLLHSPGFDAFLDQESICAKNGTMIVATECNDLIVGTLAESEVGVLIDLLYSPGFDAFLDQEIISDDSMSAKNGTIDNVAATDEPTNGLSSSIPDDYLSQEPISESANNGTINDVAASWYNPYIADEFFNLEELCQDVILSANDGTFDDLAATTTSCVPNDAWDQTFIFWSTPFFSQID